MAQKNRIIHNRIARTVGEKVTPPVERLMASVEIPAKAIEILIAKRFLNSILKSF